MKALILALALALVAQTAAKPPAPPPPAAPKPAAATAKPAPVKPAPAPASSLSPTLSASDALALCRSNCAQSHFLCLEAEDESICNPTWLQCRAKCSRANPG